jgi:N-acetylglucosaminyldiphosphoundecaprenol N-acetyl-beta-D-mannosaminyltransferase
MYRVEAGKRNVERLLSWGHNMEPISVPSKKLILGIGISTTTYTQVVQFCNQCVAERRFGKDRSQTGAKYICVTSVHGVITSFLDRSLRPAWNCAEIATPDGMPVVWALRSFGARGQPRVYGPDLMLAICEEAQHRQHRIFLYGGRDDTLDALCKNLRARFPKLEIVGTVSPPFRPLTADEDVTYVKRIVQSGADIVFVGLSTPKQERWMIQHRESLPGVVMVGVGAAFDFHAGRVRQAPKWMQRAGLEWFFRLTAEPTRLWKRYLFVTPLFIPLWAMQRIGLLKYK